MLSFVLPRKNSISRGAAGTRGKQNMLSMRGQVIAANLAAVFIVCGLDTGGIIQYTDAIVKFHPVFKEV